MARSQQSLLIGRNQGQLSNAEERRVSNTCMGLEDRVNFKVVSAERTRFLVHVDAEGEETPEIIFGADVFPGLNAIDPNSSLSHRAAIAHELTHYHRWLNKTELPEGVNESLDEALTSLEAILRYYDKFDDTEVQQLVRDAMQRIQMHLRPD